MEKIHIGYVSGVHGLRGDLKIKCTFEMPEKVFLIGNTIYLNEECHTITNSKFYKGHYLVTIDNIKDINKVEHYKGFDVYFNRKDLNLDNGYIINDLYGMTIVDSNKKYGIVKDVLDNGKYKILVVEYDKNYMIPLVPEYVKEVNLENREIMVLNVRSLIL